MTTLASLSPITRGYLVAALWTTDDDAPGGVDYEECGRADELLPHIHADSKLRASVECVAFREDHAADLAIYYTLGRDEESAGHDLWLSRNGHGTGFSDRADHRATNEQREACERLQEAAQALGGRDCTIDPIIYIE